MGDEKLSRQDPRWARLLPITICSSVQDLEHIDAIFADDERQQFYWQCYSFITKYNALAKSYVKNNQYITNFFGY